MNRQICDKQIRTRGKDVADTQMARSTCYMHRIFIISVACGGVRAVVKQH